ncbi:MAG: TraR/DksA family transcriptional regulator [bacterium]|nr:TraR/DksA family transcriptional regulator [bacterium]
MDPAPATQLSETQREELRGDLEVLRRQLRDAIEAAADGARPVELDQPAVGRVSRIDAIQQQKMLAANLSAQRARVQQVQSALARCDDDEYGECLRCGECIGYRRLKARPESFYCIDCQSARERG